MAGTVEVLDFGLAKAMDSGTAGPQDSNNSPTLTARATQMGMIIGTAAYMAPEQAKGKAVDRRADIWAFGVVLYEMLTGRRAFEGEDVSTTLAAVLMKDPEWAPLPKDTPPSLRRLITRCLLKDPKARLRDSAKPSRPRDEGTHSRPATALAPAVSAPTPLWRRGLPWALVAGLLVALVWTLASGSGSSALRRGHPAPGVAASGRRTLHRGWRGDRTLPGGCMLSASRWKCAGVCADSTSFRPRLSK